MHEFLISDLPEANCTSCFQIFSFLYRQVYNQDFSFFNRQKDAQVIYFFLNKVWQIVCLPSNLTFTYIIKFIWRRVVDNISLLSL